MDWAILVAFAKESVVSFPGVYSALVLTAIQPSYGFQINH